MQDKIKIKFGHLLTMRGDEIHGGELAVEKGKIESIGQASGKPCIDLSDCLVLPGFVNAHCHLALSAAHGKAPKTDNFPNWAFSFITQNNAISKEERIRCLHEGANALKESGVTTLADYLQMPGLLEEYASLPFRQVVFLEALGFKHGLAESVVENMETVLQTSCFPNELRQLGVAPHAPYSVSRKLFLGLRELADKYGLPFSCHVAEFPEEVQFLQDGTGDLYDLHQKLGSYDDDDWKPPGQTPLQYLDGLGIMDSLKAIHLNHLEDDMNLLAANFVSAVFCPGSTRWFGRPQWTGARKLLDAGVQVGIGTDSLASNDSLNFFEELRTAEEMLPDCSRQEILEMATWRGAEALGLETGAIATGMPADLIGLRVENQPNSLYDVPFDAAHRQVDFAMINGKVILEKKDGALHLE